MSAQPLPKRKRGKDGASRGASALTSGRQSRPEGTENIQDDSSRPTKKSRRNQGADQLETIDKPAVDPREEPANPKKKRSGQTASRPGNDPAPNEPRRSKRDRNSGDGTNWWEASTSSERPTETRASRQPQKKQTADKRTQRGQRKVPEKAEQETGRRDQAEHPRRAKKRDKAASGESSETAKPGKTAKKRARAAATAEEAASDPTEALESQDGASRHQKLNQITSRVRHIPRSTISKKWEPLDSGAVSAAMDILQGCRLPIVARLRGTARRLDHSEAIISVVAQRIFSRLSRGMPFPAASHASRTTANGVRSGHEEDLSFDRTVDSMRSLENQLNPLLHSVALLKSELEKEEKAVEADYATLRTLEANAKGEARTWRDRMKRGHALAPDVKKERGLEPNSHDMEFKLSGLSEVGLQDLQDGELASLTQQLGNHMESMKGNLHQIDGVTSAISAGRAALREVLYENLNPEEMDRVLLG